MTTFINKESYLDDIRQILSWDFPWDRLDGRNILITGATGLICSVIVDALMQNPLRRYNVYICGRNEAGARKRFPDYWNNDDFHFLKQDLNEPITTDICFQYIIHGAGFSFPAAFASDPVGTITGTIKGTAGILEYALQKGLERMVFISTGEIYGEGDTDIWQEHDSGYVDILNPRACYPTAKRAAENLCAAYVAQHNLSVSIARLSHIYGATFTDSDNRAYAQFIRCALNGSDIILKSDGASRRSYCYVADCVSAILHVLFYGNAGMAYNIADNSNLVSVRTLAETIAEEAGVSVRFQIPDSSESKGYSNVRNISLDPSLAISLGWKPQTSLKDGVKRIISILK